MRYPGDFRKNLKNSGIGIENFAGIPKIPKNNPNSLKLFLYGIIFHMKKCFEIFFLFFDNFSKIPGIGIPNILLKFSGFLHPWYRDFFSWDGKSRQKATSVIGDILLNFRF